MIVVDSSVLIDFLRGKSSPEVQLLRRLDAEASLFAIPTVCCQEVLQGVRGEREWDLVASYLATQRRLDSDDPWRTHTSTARLYFDARRRGLTPRSTVDCWIAALTIEADAELLHADADFDRLAEVSALRVIRG